MRVAFSGCSRKHDWQLCWDKADVKGKTVDLTITHDGFGELCVAPTLQ